MAADSISTARPSGKRCLMVSSSVRLVMNWSPVQTSPLWMRLSIPASFSDKACFNREHPSPRGGKTLHLSVLVTVAAPDVVIHQTLACHYIRHLQASINAARHTGADDAVRRKAPYQFRSSYRCTHLTDAALRQDYMVTAQCTFHIAETTIARRILILQAPTNRRCSLSIALIIPIVISIII